jgi:hypothetical protein
MGRTGPQMIQPDELARNEPLLWSAGTGAEVWTLFRACVDHGANPNQEVESSADAPSIAIINSETRMIELLVSYGARWTIPVQLADF